MPGIVSPAARYNEQMHQTHNQFEIHSQGKGLYDFTHDVARWLSDAGIGMVC